MMSFLVYKSRSAGTSFLDPMEKLMDLLLDQPLLFILNGFGRARHHHHLVVVVVWIILQGVLAISQPPMFKVSLIFLAQGFTMTRLDIVLFFASVI